MSVNLEISDGVPWYLSTDIWTVPGEDPEGAPGQPVVGTPCYLWARVRNNGTDMVQNAQVRFYWANPSVGFDRTTANPIGTSNVTLPGGAVSEVLCLTPWVPSFVNGGHECVLAEAFHTSLDPLAPGAVFDVPTDRHVAQRNLSVVMASNKTFHLAFEALNTSRKPGAFSIHTRQATKGELAHALSVFPKVRASLGDRQPGELNQAGFVKQACPDAAAQRDAKPVFKLELDGGARQGLSVVGHIDGGYAVVHVEQWAHNRGDKPVLVGGLSVLVIDGEAAASTSTKASSARKK